MKMNCWVRFRKGFGVTLFGGILIAHASAQMPITSPDKTSSQVFKNIKVFNNTPSDQLIPSMQFITAALGVQCEFCHVERAFDRDDKEPKQIARRMIEMTSALNERNFNGKQAVSYYSCHRGHPKPVSIPEVSDLQQPFVRAEEQQTTPPGLPKADEIVRQYALALGGPGRIAALASISAKGTVEVGPAKFQIEILKAKPDSVSTLIHFAQGDSISTFDGTLGWLLSPDRPVRAMSASEVDSNRMDGAIPFASDFGNLFPDLETVRKERLGEADTFVLLAKRSKMPPVELYFNATTMLLVRLVRYAKSPLGLLPTRIDFSDYREANGVKVPFHWVSATPTGRFSVQITTVITNAPIDRSAFSKPAGSQAGPGTN